MKWEGPNVLGDYQEALVTYTYKINDLADWIKAPAVAAAFGGAAKIVEGAGKQNLQIGERLTSVGWEVAPVR